MSLETVIAVAQHFGHNPHHNLSITVLPVTQASFTPPHAVESAQWITYEFPLNERVRTLLRLEDLFARFMHFLHQDHKLEHHCALLTLFEIIEVGSRADLKSDLLQELDRQKTQLSSYRDHPSVDQIALMTTLNDMDKAAVELNGCNGRLGYHLRDNEFLMNIRSRCSIPGGVCEFDLPGYHKWQSRPAKFRREEIRAWAEPMFPLLNAIALVLKILRSSGETAHAQSDKGNYTQQLSGKAYQLLQVHVPDALDVVPEFSANKYMLWVRFNMPVINGSSKNNPYNEPFDFKLKLCSL